MIRVAVVGATGVVGQQAIVALTNHPWFRITRLAQSRVPGKALFELDLTCRAGSLPKGETAKQRHQERCQRILGWRKPHQPDDIYCIAGDRLPMLHEG